MSCTHCAHCSAPAVLRLPQDHAPADASYDAAVLAAHAYASRRSGQPVRMIREVNPWLSKSQVRDQLRAARVRMAERATIDVTTTPMPPDLESPVHTDPLPSMVLDDSEKVARIRASHRATGRWLLPANVVGYGLAPDVDTAQRLIDMARKVHDPSL